ncbi:MAG: peroxiredoxin family protein [Candidatus Obscuribacterales bacterium]|nr:redoxin domain-containing protein [Cyanobacteria bacterium SZAS LIN-5]RTL45074.1 MAG: peroxiredoxin family protein [Candidatus Melainabacteria bacterium]
MLNEKAPDFSLESTTGQDITLSSLAGSYVVLVFYPANDSPTCNKQLSDFSINSTALMETDARVFGVNTAPANKSRSYCTRQRLEFPILSDPGGNTAKKYKAFLGWLPFIKRTVVVIDPAGNICFYERGTPAPESVLECIKQSKLAMRNN